MGLTFCQRRGCRKDPSYECRLHSLISWSLILFSVFLPASLTVLNLATLGSITLAHGSFLLLQTLKITLCPLHCKYDILWFIKYTLNQQLEPRFLVLGA